MYFIYKKMRAIIIAAGNGTRWSNYLGIPKHLIQINHEPILHRTVRLLQKNGVHDIHVVGPRDDRYHVQGSQLYVPMRKQKNYDADKFLSSQSLWHPSERTVVFYGDVFFTEEAVQTIVISDIQDWTLFCRSKASKITGGRYKECFAQSFYPKDINKHEQNLRYVAELHASGVTTRSGGWEHYYAMQGARGKEVQHWSVAKTIRREPWNFAKHIVQKRYGGRIEIDDWTEDFDYPLDYDRYIQRWNKKKTIVV